MSNSQGVSTLSEYWLDACLRTPVPFYFGPSAKGPSVATTDGGAIVVEIDEG